jgi:hypothetical protein
MPKIFTTFDNDTTTIDRSYTFVAKAKDQYGYSATTREFTINVSTPNNKLYSSISVRPFLDQEQRASFKTFINNSTIFPPSSIYRPSDSSFGLQQQLKMAIYSGIETRDAAAFVSAIGLNHKRKRFAFGDVKKAYAIYPGTKTVVYEVIYVEMVDPLEPRKQVLNNSVLEEYVDPHVIRVDSSNNFYSRETDILNITSDPYGSRPDPLITIDRTNYHASDPNNRYSYPNSVSIWRNRLKIWKDDNNVGFDTERNYLPLWMRSIQPGTKEELGFVLGIPICFCLPGKADDILLNIKYSGFDFKTLDYTVDRYVIDSVEGLTADKYLVFKNDRNTI